jgi:hypothetical protein
MSLARPEAKVPMSPLELAVPNPLLFVHAAAVQGQDRARVVLPLAHRTASVLRDTRECAGVAPVFRSFSRASDVRRLS